VESAERDFRLDVVSPEIGKLLHDRGCYLDPPDLLWGFDKAHAEAAEIAARTIFRLCLEEMEQSRPLAESGSPLMAKHVLNCVFGLLINGVPAVAQNENTEFFR